MWRLLALRQAAPDVFRFGSYVPLEVHGQRRENALAFARHFENEWAVVIVPRLCLQMIDRDSSLAADFQFPTDWGDTHVFLPADAGQTFRNVLTERFLWTSDLLSRETMEMDSVAALHSRRGLGPRTPFEQLATSAESATALLQDHSASEGIVYLREVLKPWPFAVLFSCAHLALDEGAGRSS
jgi:hypothetical protein